MPYNEVAPRTTLKKNYKDPATWPKSLHGFISASFKKASELKLDTETKKKFQAELKQLINKAIDEGKIDANSWESQTLPSLGGAGKLELYCDLVVKARKEKVVKQTQPVKQTLSKKNVFDEPPEPQPSAPLPPLKKMKRDRKTEDLMNSEKRKQLRSQRFERELSTPPPDLPSIPVNTNAPLIGKCKELEKKYLRLTSQPNPATVRPLPVLKKTLQLLIDKYYQGATYNYLCDQFKSMRQDLTVQHIKNSFTVKVYEYHCKLAIQFQDLGEFNQCQSQLKLLYDSLETPSTEFYSYRVLYYIITNNFNEAFALKSQLLEQQLQFDEYLETAFRLLEFTMTNEYWQFFQVVKTLQQKDNDDLSIKQDTIHNKVLTDQEALKLGHTVWFFFLQLLKPIIFKIRINSLATICKSYRKLSIGALREMFGDSESQLDEYFARLKLDVFVEQGMFDCVQSRQTVDQLKNQNRKIDIKGQI
ncbi:hypothetical protein OGAPHI_000680 [Ogataea philodendri]|uniref:SAC3/GANP/THP3 conserved domain-containing protein n=1 Tax=Ogataea philodendri TaxID=1378263 RepID=A0A9P8T9V6_9ASCO|nr:uncharacterized protein OGAPHI_000680 [Ogataea philodendri]KAH3670969.1 hypothetical protein OGAPHI_000680 [Ogataea philodendri]